MGLHNPRACERGKWFARSIQQDQPIVSQTEKLFCLLPLWDVGVDSLARWEPLQGTRLRALQVRLVSLSLLMAATASNF